ncbi:MAG: tetratricopeptide repeat protein [Steroidobacteraceae bacterium]
MTGRLLLVLAVAVPLAASAADRVPAEPTLKDLQKRRVEIRKDAPADADAGKAMESYRQFLDLTQTDPAMRAEALRRLGDLSLEGGELDRAAAEGASIDIGGADAIRLYTQRLQAYPDHPRNYQVLYQLARAYETTGQPEKALAALDEVVQRYPDMREIGEVHFRRGELLFSARRYADAEKAYAEVTQRGAGPFYQQALYKQGWSLFKQNLNEESLPVFGRLLDAQLRDPGSPRGMKPLDTLQRADRELVEDTLRVMSLTFSYQDGIEPLNRFVDAQGKPPYAALLYSRLGDLFVEKQRYQDGAGAYRAWVAREPNDEFSPLLSTLAIEAYRKGGFAQLVLEGKREYVGNYNLGTAFWQGRQRADYPQIVTELKTHLTDLAAYHHAEAQKSRRREDYAQAARWYRLQLESFPQDETSAQVNYRLADALYEGGDFAAAATEYEHTAYGYAPGADTAKAGYAALAAYQKQEALLPEGERQAWHMKATESGVKFAQTYPAHADSAGVLTRATEDLYKARNLPRAIEVGGILLARDPPASAAQRRIAYSVIGQSRFDQGEFAGAEAAWSQARPLAAGDPQLARTLGEQLSVAVYRQAEARRAAGDAAGAIDEFLRVASVAPGTSAVETAQYDAAAELIKLKDWPRAIGVLETFRRDYPQSPQQSDVTAKLAVAYMEAGRGEASAAEFERISSARDQAPDVRLEALGLAADQYAKSGNTSRAVAMLERLVTEFPAPAAERIETRQRLLDYARTAGDGQRVTYWQREIVKADASAGGARTDRTRYLAAKASLALAAPARDSFRALKLTAPLTRSLAPKRKALDTALAGYKAAAAYNIAEVATEASFEIAELYRQLGADLMASERPRNLDAEAIEQYDLLLEEQALPFEEQAITLHETNAARSRDGLYDAGVQASFSALAKLLPARFGKTELSIPWSEGLMLPAAAAVSYQQGSAQLARGELPAAQASFEEAARFAPENAAPLNELGIVLRQRGQFAAAAETYGRALALAPDNAAALRNVAVLRDIYLDDPVAALAPLERYQVLTGEDRPVTSWIADVKQRAGKRTSTTTPGAQAEVR